MAIPVILCAPIGYCHGVSSRENGASKRAVLPINARQFPIPFRAAQVCHRLRSKLLRRKSVRYPANPQVCSALACCICGG